MAFSAHTAKDVSAIKQLGEEYFKAANAGDVDRCVATMAPDVVVMAPDRPTIVGAEALRALSSNYHATYEVEYRLVYDEIEIAGDLAFARSTALGTRKSRSDGRIEMVAWRNLWVFRRQIDGNWNFWRIIFNSAIPPE